MINLQILKESWKYVPKTLVSVQLGFLLIIVATEIGATLLIPTWRKYFYDTLSTFNQAGFQWALIYYIMLFSSLTLAQGLKRWIEQHVALHFRAGLTNYLSSLWVQHPERKELSLDNPCQRINQDTALCTALTLNVITEIIISGILVIALFIQTLQDTTIMEIAIIYTGIIVAMTYLFKPVLVAREIDLQKAEANHRLALSEITLGQSDTLDKPTIMFEYVKKAYKAFISTAMKYEFFNRSQGNFAPVLIYLFLAPLYFAKTITLGKYMGDTAMFELIVVNSTILVQLFPSLTTASASWKRLDKFYNSVKETK